VDPRSFYPRPRNRRKSGRSATVLAATTVTTVLVAVLITMYYPWTPVTASAHRIMSSWDRRDSAAYVVSTLNLVHCRDGRPLAPILSQRYPGARYDVFVDQQISNLFFIEPRRADGSTVGALAYQLGWLAPMSVTSSLSALHVRSAPAAVYSEFRTDAKQFIGTFSSTVPT
jgi:hypothetical protein